MLNTQIREVQNLGVHQLEIVKEERLARIPIDKNKLPALITILHDGRGYDFTFRYNMQGGFFTVDHEDVHGVKITYGQKTLGKFTPYNLSEKETRVTWDNFGVSVFLYVGDIDV